MTTSLKSLRAKSASLQSFHCYYCGLPMWDRDPEGFARQYRLSLRQAMLMRCTAEHLISRSEGGANSRSNIVAACLYCNGNRHKQKKAPAPSVYRQHVRHRMQRGKWLASLLPCPFLMKSTLLTGTGHT